MSDPLAPAESEKKLEGFSLWMMGLWEAPHQAPPLGVELSSPITEGRNTYGLWCSVRSCLYLSVATGNGTHLFQLFNADGVNYNLASSTLFPSNRLLLWKPGKREIRFTLIQNTKWTIKRTKSRFNAHHLKLCNAFCRPATRGQHYTKRETMSEKREMCNWEILFFPL